MVALFYFISQKQEQPAQTPPHTLVFFATRAPTARIGVPVQYSRDVPLGGSLQQVVR